MRWVMARTLSRRGPLARRRPGPRAPGRRRSGRRAGRPAQRDDAAPDPGLDVLGVVDRALGAGLHRRLVQRHGEHGGRGQLLAGVGAQRRRPPGIMWSTIRSRACPRSASSSTSRAGADDDGGAVVHRVVEGRARGDQPVELGDRDADRGVGRAPRSQPARRPSRARRACRPRRARPRSTANAVGSTSGWLPVADRRRGGDQGVVEQPCSSARSSTIRLRPRPTVVRAVGREWRWSWD